MTTTTLNNRKLFAYLIVDEIETEEGVLKKAQNGDASSLSKIGDIYYNKSDYTKAVYWFRLAATKNDAYSKYKLGCMYQDGKGVSTDFKIAMEWYLKAYTNGETESAYQIGCLYHIGNGVKEDDDIALKWFHEVSNKGSKEAQKNIGECYENGYGVNVDEKYALEWYEKSCAESNISYLNRQGVYITDRQRSCMKVEKDLEEEKSKIEALENQLKESKLTLSNTVIEMNKLKQQFEALELTLNIDTSKHVAPEEGSTGDPSEITSDTISEWIRTTTVEDFKFDEENPKNNSTH